MAKVNTTKSTSLKLPTSPDGYDRRDQDLTRRLIESAFATFSLGIQQSSGGDPKVGDLGVTVGKGLLDFGAYPGTGDTTLVITGQSLIKAATSVAWAWVFPADTADHTADEHFVDPPFVLAGAIVEGTGFTIYGRVPDEQEQVDLPWLPNQMSAPGTQGISPIFAQAAKAIAGGEVPKGKSYGLIGTTRMKDNRFVYGKWTVAWAWR